MSQPRISKKVLCQFYKDFKIFLIFIIKNFFSYFHLVYCTFPLLINYQNKCVVVTFLCVPFVSCFVCEFCERISPFFINLKAHNLGFNHGLTHNKRNFLLFHSLSFFSLLCIPKIIILPCKLSKPQLNRNLTQPNIPPPQKLNVSNISVVTDLILMKL